MSLRQDPRKCIFNKLLGDAEGTCLWTTLGEALLASALPDNTQVPLKISF